MWLNKVWEGMFGKGIWSREEVEGRVWEGILKWKWWKDLFWRKVLRNVREY